MIESGHPISQLANLRDLGNLAGRYGTIRSGLLFRSDDVSTIDEEQAARLAEKGLALIIDLRSTHEREQGRGPLGDYNIDYVSLPLLQHANSGEDLAAILASGGFTNGMLGTWYHEVLRRSLPMLVDGLEAIAEADGPVLFHCAIGKDRTGIFAVAVHGALGTHRDQIVADYAATNDNLPQVLARLAASQPMWTPEAMRQAGALLRADAEAMEVLLDAVEAEDTDVESMLIAAGATDTLLHQLRHWALEPSPAGDPQRR